MMNKLLRRSFIFGAAMSVATSLSAQSLRDGLEIYIPFDEGTGNKASDLSGNNRSMFPENNLFPGAEVNWSGGRFGGSAKFNYDYFMTSPDYLGIGDDAARTISFWVRLGPDDNNPNGAGGAVLRPRISILVEVDFLITPFLAKHPVVQRQIVTLTV